MIKHDFNSVQESTSSLSVDKCKDVLTTFGCCLMISLLYLCKNPFAVLSVGNPRTSTHAQEHVTAGIFTDTGSALSHSHVSSVGACAVENATDY